MRIGLWSFPGRPLDELVQQIVEAEGQGFDSFWLGQAMHADALTVLALAGQKTQRIELGTAVVVTYTRHPVAMAQQALVIQAASAGRLALGLGPSHKVVIENTWGLSFAGPAQHVREYVSVLRSLVYEGSVSFEGRFFKINASLTVPGGRPFPILVSALGPVMLQVAGEVADGTITWVTGRKTIESHIVPKMSAAAQAAGRPPPRVCVALPIAVSDDVVAARERVGRAFSVYGQLPSYRRVLDLEGVQGAEEVAVIGNEGEVQRQLRALAEVGATDFLAVPISVGEDREASLARTRACLREFLAVRGST